MKGFTLVELLVAISIIAVLSTVGTVSYSNSRKAAQDLKIKADIDAIAKAYESTFNVRTGKYGVITGENFTSGEIPTLPNGTPYPITVAPDQKSFNVSVPTSDGSNYTRSSYIGLPPTATPLPTATPTPECPRVPSLSSSSDLTCKFDGIYWNVDYTQRLLLPQDSTIYVNCPSTEYDASIKVSALKICSPNPDPYIQICTNASFNLYNQNVGGSYVGYVTLGGTTACIGRQYTIKVRLHKP